MHPVAEDGVLLGKLLHKVGIARRDFGGEVGVPYLEGQRHPLVALQLAALLVALQLSVSFRQLLSKSRL